MARLDAAATALTTEGFCDMTQDLASACPQVSTTRGHFLVSPKERYDEFCTPTVQDRLRPG